MIVLMVASAGISVAQQPVGTPALVEPVNYATKVIWAIDLLVPIARNEVAIHQYGKNIPRSTDSPDHVRWFAVWNTQSNDYMAVPIILQSEENQNVTQWLMTNGYVDDNWSGKAWIGTSIPIAKVSEPVFRGDLRDFNISQVGLRAPFDR